MSFILLAALQWIPAADHGTFENFNLPPNGFLSNAGNGANGFFNTGDNRFNNNYNAGFDAWAGFAVSNVVDATTPDYSNQYAAITGSGAGGSAHYGVAYTFGPDADPQSPNSSFVNVAPGHRALSFAVTNTTYSYFSMRDGTGFSHAFSTANQDFFRLTVSAFAGQDGAGASLGSFDYYLADYRSGNNFILDTWQTLDLTGLGTAGSYRFSLASNDNDTMFGMNNPAYFALDDFMIAPIPEPGSAVLILAAGASGLGLRFRRKTS